MAQWFKSYGCLQNKDPLGPLKTPKTPKLETKTILVMFHMYNNWNSYIKSLRHLFELSLSPKLSFFEGKRLSFKMCTTFHS